MLLLFAIAGFSRWKKEGKEKPLFPLLGGTLFLFIIAYTSPHNVFFAQLQPQRFTIPLNIFLIIPASVGMTLVFQTLLKGRSMPASRLIASLKSAMLVCPVAKPLKAIYSYILYGLSCEFTDPLTDLLT